MVTLRSIFQDVSFSPLAKPGGVWSSISVCACVCVCFYVCVFVYSAVYPIPGCGASSLGDQGLYSRFLNGADIDYWRGQTPRHMVLMQALKASGRLTALLSTIKAPLDPHKDRPSYETISPLNTWILKKRLWLTYNDEYFSS